MPAATRALQQLTKADTHLQRAIHAASSQPPAVAEAIQAVRDSVTAAREELARWRSINS